MQQHNKMSCMILVAGIIYECATNVSTCMTGTFQVHLVSFSDKVWNMYWPAAIPLTAKFETSKFQTPEMYNQIGRFTLHRPSMAV